MGEEHWQRFCACSTVSTLQWIVSVEGASCDATCSEHGGMCDNVGTSVWPMDESHMASVTQNAGVSCSTTTFGETDAAPSITSTGQCHWSKAGGTPQCSTSE